LKYQYITPEIEKEIIDFFVKSKLSIVVAKVEGSFDLIVLFSVKNFPKMYDFWEKTLAKYRDYFADQAFSVYFKEYLYRYSFLLDEKISARSNITKVEIFGVFDGIDAANLPWAVPAFPIFCGSGDGIGYFAVPEIGTYVWCFFESGDFNQPVYFAEASDGVHGLPTERTSNYPDTKVLKTPSGIVVSINDSIKEVKVEHPSGASLVIDSSGNIIIKGTTVSINP